MAAYVVGHISVTDPETYREYMEKVPAIIAAAGGEYLVRGGASEVVEGAFPGNRTVVLRFADMAAARAFYHGAAYAPVRAIRQASSTGALMLVEGV